MKKLQCATITSKGQITIPIDIRNEFNLSAGSEIEFLTQDNHILVLPRNKSITSLKGMLPKPGKTLSCQQMDEIIRNRKTR